MGDLHRISIQLKKSINSKLDFMSIITHYKFQDIKLAKFQKLRKFLPAVDPKSKSEFQNPVTPARIPSIYDTK